MLPGYFAQEKALCACTQPETRTQRHLWYLLGGGVASSFPQSAIERERVMMTGAWNHLSKGASAEMVKNELVREHHLRLCPTLYSRQRSQQDERC